MASSYVNTGRQVVDDYLDYQNQKSHRDQNDDNDDDRNHLNNNKHDNDDDDDNRNRRNVNENHNNQVRQQQQQQQQLQQHRQQAQQLQHQNQKQPNHNRQNNNSNQSDPTYNGFMKYQENGQNYNSNSGSQKSLSLEYGKSIKLLRNGDEFYRGQKYVINSRKYRYFDVFLDDISDKMNAQFGAVRTIHTPVNGHRVKNLEEMEDGKTYVAAGSGRFVRLK